MLAIWIRWYSELLKKVLFINLICLLFLLSNCQTIKQKTDAIVEKENLKLSKYIGKTMSNLQVDLGKSDEDFKNEKGNTELVYNSKKYLVPCERRFEIDSNSIVIGFVSNGCFWFILEAILPKKIDNFWNSWGVNPHK